MKEIRAAASKSRYKKSDFGRGIGMRKLSGAIASLMLIAGSLFITAGPAQASCETELGDMCRAYGVICRSAHNQAPVLDKVHDCPNW
jgi:hypothetical protein